jgi:hypothetical protein
MLSGWQGQVIAMKARWRWSVDPCSGVFAGCGYSAGWLQRGCWYERKTDR